MSPSQGASIRGRNNEPMADSWIEKELAQKQNLYDYMLLYVTNPLGSHQYRLTRVYVQLANVLTFRFFKI